MVFLRQSKHWRIWFAFGNLSGPSSIYHTTVVSYGLGVCFFCLTLNN